MLEESLIVSIWASMNSWFTPTVLFVLLNLMIGTIAIATSLGSHQKPEEEQNKPPHQIYRAPSLLERLKSIDLYRYRSTEIPTTTTTLISPPPDPADSNDEDDSNNSSVDQEQEEHHDQFEEEEEEEEDDRVLVVEEDERHVTRCKSDTKPSSGEIPVKLSKKIKKSASAKSAFGYFEEKEIPVVEERRRPATVKEGKKNASDSMGFGDDEEVDAKADDFINRFKHQLKLQRLDSIIRYKEMINRGSAR